MKGNFVYLSLRIVKWGLRHDGRKVKLFENKGKRGVEETIRECVIKVGQMLVNWHKRFWMTLSLCVCTVKVFWCKDIEGRQLKLFINCLCPLRGTLNFFTILYTLIQSLDPEDIFVLSNKWNAITWYTAILLPFPE